MKTAFGDVLRTKPGVGRDVTIMVIGSSPSVGPRPGALVLVLDADGLSSRRYWKIGDRVQIEDEDMERFEPAPPSHVIEDQEMAARLGITEGVAAGWRFVQAQADAQKAAAPYGHDDPLAGGRFDKNGRWLP